MSNLGELWVEKYRPETTANFTFFSNEYKQFFDKCIEEKSIPNLMFYGSAGTGKTTLAKSLVNDIGIEKSDILRINASEENGIEVVRDKIQNFISTMPYGDFKVVILEEANRLSKQAQDSLKVVLEENYEFVRFICTTNEIKGFSEAFLSRFVRFDFFNSNYESMLTTCIQALVEEDTLINDPEGIEAVEAVLKKHLPDMRSVWNELQRLSRAKSLSHDTFTIKNVVEELLTVLVEQNWLTARQYMNSNFKNVAPVHEEMLQDLCYAVVNRYGTQAAMSVVLISDALKYIGTVANPELLSTSTLIQMKESLK